MTTKPYRAKSLSGAQQRVRQLDTKKPTNEQLRIAVAELRGWCWYRIPNMRGDNRRYRTLFHPTIHEADGQIDIWKVRADGTEKQTNWDYMERDGFVPKLDYNELAIARKELLTTDDLKDQFTLALKRIIIHGTKFTSTCDWDMVDATPEQQAIALCKMFGKEIK